MLSQIASIPRKMTSVIDQARGHLQAGGRAESEAVFVLEFVFVLVLVGADVDRPHADSGSGQLRASRLDVGDLDHQRRLVGDAVGAREREPAAAHVELGPAVLVHVRRLGL